MACRMVVDGNIGHFFGHQKKATLSDILKPPSCGLTLYVYMCIIQPPKIDKYLLHPQGYGVTRVSNNYVTKIYSPRIKAVRRPAASIVAATGPI